MKKIEYNKSHLAAVAVIIVAFIAGYALKSIFPSGNVAIIDLPAIGSQAKELQALQEEQQTKSIELQQWLVKAQEEIKKQPNEQKKEEMTKKFEKELTEKQTAIQNEYNQKLQALDSRIRQLIADEAKSLGYSAVMVKGAVMYGGDDITTQILEVLNK